ncbi:MAG: NADPH-dependent F420 reductase [Methanobrevibacter sp.]|jgi:NADPH-dependent F420 reductase|nr:NADPH-dependent F420 reductase [Methanobrevibacter sp.]
MKIAILGGTGDQGLGLAIRFIQANQEVIIGSRSIEKAQKAVAEIENYIGKEEAKNIQAMTNEDAAAAGDILVLTVPLTAQIATLKSIKEFVNGKIVIDATVPLCSTIGGSPTECVDVWEGSAAERAAKVLKGSGAKILAAFNNISSASLLDFKNDVGCDCLIAGDDEESKKIAIDIINKFPGVAAIDCGPLSKARYIEKITPLLIGLNIKYKTHYGGIKIVGLDRK